MTLSFRNYKKNKTRRGVPDYFKSRNMEERERDRETERQRSGERANLERENSM